MFIWLLPEIAFFLRTINSILTPQTYTWLNLGPLTLFQSTLHPFNTCSNEIQVTRKPIYYKVGRPKNCGSIPNMGMRFFPPKHPGLSPGSTHPFPYSVTTTNLSSGVYSTCDMKLTTHHLGLHYKRLELLFQSQISLCLHGLNAYTQEQLYLWKLKFKTISSINTAQLPVIQTLNNMAVWEPQIIFCPGCFCYTLMWTPLTNAIILDWRFSPDSSSVINVEHNLG